MSEFGIARAWSAGLRILAARPLGHALLLIGLGIGVPLALQLLIGGRAVGFTGGANLTSAALSGGAAVVAVLLVGYLLQGAAYFASLRLGLDPEAGLGGAALYGLAAALVAAIGSGVLIVVLVAGAAQFSDVLAPLVTLILLALLAAAFAPLLAGLMGVGAAVALILMMIYGAATGNVGLAATMVGGSGFVVVLLILFCAALLWLAARLSCTTAVMASRRSFNPFAALAESWRLTWESQFQIMAYLALVGLASLVLLFAVSAGVGMAMVAGGGPATGMDAALGGIFVAILSIPFAYLAVLVPGGIHRTLAETTSGAAEVFA